MMLGVAALSGLGDLDPTDVEHWMAGKSLAVAPDVDEGWETFSGHASPADLEAAMQVLHAMVTKPRFTEAGLALALDQQRAAILNRDNNPQIRFNDAYLALVWKDDPRRQPWTLQDLDSVTLDRVTRVYGERLGHMSDATFVFVGAIPDDFERIVTTWLATLPANGAPETGADRGKRPVPGKLEQVVRSGIDPQGRVRLEWRGDLAPNTWEKRNQLYALVDVLDTMLRVKVREKLGGTYGVSVTAVEEYFPKDSYLVRIEFPCDPGRVDELVGAVEQVVAQLRTEGPPLDVVQQTQATKRRGRESDLRSNAFWASAFAGALKRPGADPLPILQFDQRIDALTPEVLKAAANAWLVDAQRVKVVLLPVAGADGSGKAP
jgi:zinc protease